MSHRTSFLEISPKTTYVLKNFKFLGLISKNKSQPAVALVICTSWPFLRIFFIFVNKMRMVFGIIQRLTNLRLSLIRRLFMALLRNISIFYSILMAWNLKCSRMRIMVIFYQVFGLKHKYSFSFFRFIQKLKIFRKMKNRCEHFRIFPLEINQI